MDQAVTAGFIRFRLTADGNPIGPEFDMDSTRGTKALWEFAPGELVGSKGTSVGVVLGTSGTLLPAGTIEALVIIDVQFIGG